MEDTKALQHDPQPFNPPGDVDAIKREARHVESITDPKAAYIAQQTAFRDGVLKAKSLEDLQAQVRIFDPEKGWAAIIRNTDYATRTPTRSPASSLHDVDKTQ